MGKSYILKVERAKHNKGEDMGCTEFKMGQHEQSRQKIDLESCKPTHDFDDNKLRNTLGTIWEYIECNFDKKVEEVIVIGTDAQFYTSYLLDDSQNERLMDSFNIICGVESCNNFTLISLDI